MPESEKIYKDNRFHEKRVAWTVGFVKANLNPGAKILDKTPLESDCRFKFRVKSVYFLS